MSTKNGDDVRWQRPNEIPPVEMALKFRIRNKLNAKWMWVKCAAHLNAENLSFSVLGSSYNFQIGFENKMQTERDETGTVDRYQWAWPWERKMKVALVKMKRPKTGEQFVSSRMHKHWACHVYAQLMPVAMVVFFSWRDAIQQGDIKSGEQTIQLNRHTRTHTHTI